MLSEQYKADIALSGRTANHDSHCSNCRSVMLLPHHKTLQHNCAQQSKSAQSDKHRDIETSCACSMTVHLEHSDFAAKFSASFMIGKPRLPTLRQRQAGLHGTPPQKGWSLTHKTTDHVQDIDQG